MTPVHLFSHVSRNPFRRINSINRSVIRNESISGICITVVVALVFMLLAKICFGNQGSGVETFMLCGLLLLLVSSCMCCRALQNRQCNTQENITATNVSEGENVSQVAPTTVRQNSPSSTSEQQNLPPPPPYRIAILVSSPDTEEEPPPSYVIATK